MSSGAAPPTDPPPPAPGRWRDTGIDAVWLLLLAAWSAAWCLSAAGHLGPTYDEPFYLQAGIEHWRSGVPERIATHGVMPLPVDVLSLPLHRHEQRTGEKVNDFDTAELLEHLITARSTTLLWLWLLLLSALRLGRAAGGPWAGRVASGLIAADPNFLAHSSMATTDLALAAALLAFARAVYVGRAGGAWGRVLLPGLWYGFAVLCKLSALLYGGVIIVVLEIAFRFSSGAMSRPTGAGRGEWARRVAWATAKSVLAVAAVLAVGISLVLWAFGEPPPVGIVDGGWSWALNKPPKYRNPMAQLLPKIPDDEPMKPRFVRLAKDHPDAHYAAVAFAFQWWHNSDGRPTYLNGTYYPHGVWYYFPVLLAMKLPLPVMLLGLLAIARPRALLNPSTITAVVLLGVVLTGKVATGIRLVLPVVALAYVGVSVAVCRGCPRLGKVAGLLAVAVTAGVSAWVWPHGLGYLNQLAGGPGAAFERVSDSNIDWGQGVPDLVKWHKANGAPPMAVWYFGTDPVAAQPPFEQLFIERSPVTTQEEFRSVVGKRFLAVGATVLTMHPHEPHPKQVSMQYLLKLQPVARTATFVIYDFRNAPPATP